MKWARWHRGTVTNPKFKMVARRATENLTREVSVRTVSLTAVLAIWCVMFEDAMKKDHWGTVEKDAEYIAVMLDLCTLEVQSVIDELIKEGTLEQGDTGLNVLNWNKYQYSSDHDPTSPERQRRYYNKHKKKPNANLTREVPLANVRLTPPDTDTEKNKKEQILNNGSGQEVVGELVSKPKRHTGHLCPEDFRPTAQHYESAASLGMGRQIVEWICVQMHDWSHANANRAIARKSNWGLALHSWIRNHAEQHGYIKQPPKSTDGIT